MGWAWRLIITIVFTFIIGHFGTNKLVKWLHSYAGHDRKWVKENIDCNIPAVPPWVLGTLERLFATVLVAFDVSAASAGIGAWLGIKMATNWNRINPKRGRDNWIPSAGSTTTREEHQEQQRAQQEANFRTYAYVSLFGSLISMLFALIGGLIYNNKIWCFPQ